MVIIVSEASNRYMHLFLVEREYFGFNTLEILRGYYMTFSILALVSARYSHIETDSEAEELIWVED
jgi:hypothetical protein